MSKKKISAFEFAIMALADPEEAKKYEPFTRKEELQQRETMLREQAKLLKVTHPNQQ